MNNNNLKNTCSRHNLSSTNGARCLQTGHWSDCEPASSYHSRAATVDTLHVQNRRIRVGAVTRHQCRVSQIQASHLLTTVTSHNHALSTCIRKNFNIRGLNTGWSTTLILPQRKRLPWIAHWKGTNNSKRWH